MNLLAIETSTNTASVALTVNGQLFAMDEQTPQQHAQRLLPMVESLLKEASVTLSELDGLVFGRGPGSFTGLRIACSLAKGLAYGADLALYPVSSLAAITEEAKTKFNTTLPILAVIDARMNEVYWSYENEREQVSSITAITFNSNAPFVLAGVGYQQYLAQLPKMLQDQLIKDIEIYPNASAMLRLVSHGKIAAINVADALPYYIRDKVT